MKQFARISTDYFSILCAAIVITFAALMLAGIMRIGIAILMKIGVYTWLNS